MADEIYDFGYGQSGDIDVNTNVAGTDDIYDFGYNRPGDVSVDGTQVGGFDLGSFLSTLQSGTSGIGGVLKNIFGGGYGDVTKMAAFGGLAALLNKMFQQKPDPVGYQYGVPRYTATRTQTPIAQQRPTTTDAAGKVIPYRPGQGGITYFSPMQYAYAGYEPKKAEEFLKAPAGVTPPPAGNKPDAGEPAIPPENVNLAHAASGQTPGGNGLGSIANALNIKTIPGQPDQKQDYGQYGFDPALVDYLNRQRQQSVMDSGVDWTYDPSTQTFSGFDMSGPLTSSLAEMKSQAGVKAASGGYMPGGIAMLAGGRYLRGPGDGVSDSIPAKFERSGQPARLADGEFVIDARTVSEIGNGSSEAGARKLYAMMDRVHAARKKAKRGKPSGADKFLPK